jgi:DNA-binding beta-propeller fold protein YncE
MKRNLLTESLFVVLALAIVALPVSGQLTASQTSSFAVGDGPEAVAFDGSNVWVANQFSDTVTKVRASDGAVLGTYAVGNRPVALAFDGSSIWVANYLSDTITKLKASTGATLGTFDAGDGPGGLLFDGTNIWIANRNSNNLIIRRKS